MAFHLEFPFRSSFRITQHPGVRETSFRACRRSALIFRIREVKSWETWCKESVSELLRSIIICWNSSNELLSRCYFFLRFLKWSFSWDVKWSGSPSGALGNFNFLFGVVYTCDFTSEISLNFQHFAHTKNFIKSMLIT